MYDLRVHSHNIPQKFNTDKNNKKNNSTKLRAVKEEGPCIIGGEYPDNRFSTQQGNN